MMHQEGTKQLQASPPQAEPHKMDTREEGLTHQAFVSGSSVGGAASDTLRVSLLPGEWEEFIRHLEAREKGLAVSVVLRGDAPGQWPTDEQLGRLVSRSCMEVVVPWFMELGEREPEQSVHFVRFLRDCTSHRMRVRWRGWAALPVSPWTLHHLEPPRQDGSGAQADAARRWSVDHAYGRCFWRAGPGFVLLKDTRVGREPARFTLDEDVPREVFAKLAIPRRMDELGTAPEVRKALADFQEEEFVLRLGEWMVALPYRLRHWPIPFDII